jgi:hypothetical protein
VRSILTIAFSLLILCALYVAGSGHRPAFAQSSAPSPAPSTSGSGVLYQLCQNTAFSTELQVCADGSNPSPSSPLQVLQQQCAALPQSPACYEAIVFQAEATGTPINLSSIYRPVCQNEAAATEAGNGLAGPIDTVTNLVLGMMSTGGAPPAPGSPAPASSSAPLLGALPYPAAMNNLGWLTWMQNGLYIAQYIFFALLGIQIIQDVADYMLETAGGGSLSGFLTRYAKMLLLNGLTIVCFLNSPQIIASAFSAAAGAGIAITGQQAPSQVSDILNPATFKPGYLAAEGSCLANDVWTVVHETYAYQNEQFVNTQFGGWDKSSDWTINNWTSALGDFFQSIGTLIPNGLELLGLLLFMVGCATICSLLIWVTFLALSIMFLFVSLEVVFISGIGMISMGALGHRSFHQLPIGFLNRCFGLMMKVVALGALVGIGDQLVPTWETQIMVGPLDPVYFGSLFVNLGFMAITYLFLALKLPESVDATFGGGLSSTMSSSPARSIGGVAQGLVAKGVSGVFGGRGGGGKNGGGGNSSPPSSLSGGIRSGSPGVVSGGGGGGGGGGRSGGSGKV